MQSLPLEATISMFSVLVLKFQCMSIQSWTECIYIYVDYYSERMVSAPAALPWPLCKAVLHSGSLSRGCRSFEGADSSPSSWILPSESPYTSANATSRWPPPHSAISVTKREGIELVGRHFCMANHLLCKSRLIYITTAVFLNESNLLSVNAEFSGQTSASVE